MKIICDEVNFVEYEDSVASARGTAGKNIAMEFDTDTRLLTVTRTTKSGKRTALVPAERIARIYAAMPAPAKAPEKPKG